MWNLFYSHIRDVQRFEFESIMQLVLCRGYSVKKVFFKLFQNSQENTCIGVYLLLIKLQAYACKIILKGPGTGVFLWIL